MRTQYHLRPGEHGLLAWDVERLLALVRDRAVEHVPLAAVRELDEEYWSVGGAPLTVRAVVEHLRLIDEADLAYPIVLDPEGRVMDGMHRVAKALLLGQQTIAARRLTVLPEPDHVGVRPEDLPYDR